MKKIERSHKFLRNLKSQGLSLNTIIIAAIVLIVLVVLWAVFTGRMGVFSREVTEVTKGGTCAEAGGVMRLETAGGCSELCTPIFGKFSDITTGQVCCRPIGVCRGGVGCGAATREEDCRAASTEDVTCEWVPPDTGNC